MPARGLPAAVVLAFAAVASGSALSPAPDWAGEGNQASAHYGYAVAAAGDVNGDGRSDILVGARDYDAGQSNEGRALVYHGGPAGPSPSADWTAEANQQLSFFGQILAPAGDVNGDGYGDVVVGAPNHDSTLVGEGRAYVFLGSASGLDSLPVWTADGGQQGAVFGSGVGTAGDVNGDGYDDLIVGSRGWSGADTSEGRAYVYHGGPTGPAASAAWTADGGEHDAALGWSVGTAGDVNGDGYADVIVGAFFQDGASGDEGEARVYLGGPGGLAAAPVWTAQGTVQDASFGWSVATAGDVNGDGYADVIVGARFHTASFLEEGRACVFHGSAAGVDSLPAWSVDGGETKAHLGWSVAPAGDVNGDGYADVVVGAPRLDHTWQDDGTALVYAGSASGLSTEPLWIGGALQPTALFGWSVSGAGDVDGDGYADVIVGAINWDGGQSDEGGAFLFRGAPGPPDTLHSWRGTAGGSAVSYGSVADWAGDVNGDGLSDLLVSDPLFSGPESGEGRCDVYLASPSGIDTSPDWSGEGNEAGAGYGRAAARAGDVNGDGYDDVVIGAPLDDTAFPNAGRCEVVQGSATGLAASAAWQTFGASPSSFFGQSVAGGGDGNGDGYADVLIGSYRHDGAVADAGAVFLYTGSAAGLSTAPAVVLEGQEGLGEFGRCVAWAGDVDGDGLSDALVGEPAAAGSGKVHLYKGTRDGLAPAPLWSAAGIQPDARFGDRVAAAGDVDGDGFADFVVCAPLHDGGEADEGRVSLYLGGPQGPGPAPVWTFEADQEGASLGEARGVGDLTGDGLGDLLVAAAFYSDTESLEGRVWLFPGSAGGVPGAAILTLSGGSSLAQLGTRVAGPGDAHGDGAGDLLLGAPGFADSVGSGGAAFLHAGNGGPAPPRAVRQMRADGQGPIALLGRSESGEAFSLEGTGRSGAGRALVAMEWEGVEGTTPFAAAGITGPATDTGAPVPGLGSRVALSGQVTGLPPSALARWRVRFVSPSPWFPRTPWTHHPGNSVTEPDLRTAPPPAATPPQRGPRTTLPSLSVAPVPFRDALRIRLFLPAPARVRLTVHDVAGRLVAILAEGPVREGVQLRLWDGRDRRGVPAAPGVYFLRLEAGGAQASARAVRLR